MNDLNEASKETNASINEVSRREVLKLSDLDAGSISDLSGMFGAWKEADHCDKD